ncbi:prolyl-tRNA synthetase associated domain-containing protein [Oscillibacter hominis]|uniref:Prolyl-tRNA synthetase associated domain-containing protein n=1 Tax=Oscillibacter hominis TaxID=2763056 RepID=A0A7G9B5K1_9FIRM|nr:prolyl-tRNA synthetase associated domain-containing protein [Oscillibacter hominis]QNL44832.1 prolyl-tRNA synthetase associated domain-containing protein [Oscillibacter hominis]
MDFMEQRKNRGGEELLALLKRLNIRYELYEHEAFFTVEEAEQLGLVMPGLNLKCLLIKDKKTLRFYLVVLEDHRQLDSRHFAKSTGWRRPTFAGADELYEKLGLTPGSVSPLGLVNNREHDVVLVLERAVLDADGQELLNFHPCRNTATMGIRKCDFLRLVEELGNPVVWEQEETQ